MLAAAVTTIFQVVAMVALGYCGACIRELARRDFALSGRDDLGEPGVEGRLVDKGSPEQLPAAFAQLSGDGDRRRRPGSRARETGEKRLSVQRHADDVDGFLRPQVIS